RRTSSPRSAGSVQLAGRVALVTGAGRRVGRALALALGARGMRVAVHYHASRAGADETARRIAAAGSEARVFAADLRDVAACERLVDEVASSFGALDVLVNSAAVMLRTPVGEVTAGQWDDIFALNLRAPFFLARAAARAMGERGGAIVNIADLAGLEVWPGYLPHGASKAGVIYLTRALARTLAPRVRVNAVAPGAVLLPDDWPEESAERLARTTPLQRLGAPEDVAGAVLYLLEADYVTGDTIVVDGGRHVR
ncbi:MAG TPA: SDR family oxidoreductase, partial [Gemmatimonadaceae bacterium]|nr:SDR family oxidoreductase [Gemmatimonadaceae bacterium]